MGLIPQYLTNLISLDVLKQRPRRKGAPVFGRSVDEVINYDFCHLDIKDNIGLIKFCAWIVICSVALPLHLNESGGEISYCNRELSYNLLVLTCRFCRAVPQRSIDLNPSMLTFRRARTADKHISAIARKCVKEGIVSRANCSTQIYLRGLMFGSLRQQRRRG